jgi:adenylylsulfate kinase
VVGASVPAGPEPLLDDDELPPPQAAATNASARTAPGRDSRKVEFLNRICEEWQRSFRFVNPFPENQIIFVRNRYRGRVAEVSQGLTVWLTGLPSAGKTTLARALEKRLLADGHRVEVLDGDVVRTHLTKGLGFSRADREENVRRIGFVAHLLSRNGVVVVASVISPYRAVRDELRDLHAGRFFEVHVATPVEVCAERDVKGLYAKQRAGELHGLTGVDDPYEPPLHPEAVIHTEDQTLDESVETLWQALLSS